MLKKQVNIALQGGGAHGAFTWGVLDKILEDGRIDISAISGTSAGAMNAVALIRGFHSGGNDGAREKLEQLWHKLSQKYKLSPVQRTPLDMFMGNWNLSTSPGFHFYDALTRLYSPYQLNPLNINPLQEVMNELIDFDEVRTCSKIKLYISATNVETGRVRVFTCGDVTADVIVASSCLPMIFQAVQIDGVPYWDGGYMGNPSLFPFHHDTDCSDIVVVQINPIERKGTPKTPQDIANRINEISFNSSLLKELRSIDFVSRLIQEGKLSADDYRDTRVHIIENEGELIPMGAPSKMNMEWSFLTHLRDLGRDTAEAWIDKSHKHIGKKSTVDLRAMFQGINSTRSG